MDIIEEKIFEFSSWIYQSYGWIGSVAFFLLYLAVLALTFFLLNLLPEPKTVILWSKCASCRYKRKESNVFVLACPKHEELRWNQFRTPLCPRQDEFEEWEVIKNQSSPLIVRRDSHIGSYDLNKIIRSANFAKR